ncbi:MAG: DNA polymerase III subunit gamma/tau [Bacteroidales bacterium]|nr:DNA polymerase III subunit gamma/tau [Bacteroidales bacterium]
MDNFLVSARKYRPDTFASVVGQDHVTRTLKNAIRNNQLAQSFLFTGPRGIGKTTCARILAKTINCENLTHDIEPCNQCESCVSFNKSTSFNIHELDAASNSSVDNIRSLIDQVRVPPHHGRYKIYIIDEVHMLSSQAFNAFLKTLEEPPPYAKFILATTERHKIIPTILSRCQIYDFKRISVDDIARHLRFVADSEKVQAEDEALQIIAQKADGALRDALSIFDQLVSFTGMDLKYSTVVESLNVLDYDYYFTITSHLMQGKLHDALLVLDKIIDSGFDGQHFLSGLGSHLRDLLICQDERTVRLLEVGEKTKARYHQQAIATDPAFLLRALNIVQKTDYNYKTGNNKRLHLEIALMQIASPAMDLAAPDVMVAGAVAADASKKKTVAAPESPAASSPSPVKPAQPPTPAAASTVVHATPVAQRSNVQETVKAAPPKNQPATNGFIPGSISIKDDIEPADEEEDEEEKQFDFDSEEFRLAPKFGKEELVAAWHDMIDHIPDDKPDLRSTLLAAEPEPAENFVVTFVVSNPIQQSKIGENKQDIVPFLCDQLNNRFVTLDVIVSDVPATDAPPVTSEEKFRHMAAKNQALLYLQKKFELEP